MSSWGESSSYTYDNICRAVRCVQKGARLIGTNTDLTAPHGKRHHPGLPGPGGPHRAGHGKGGLLYRKAQSPDDAHRHQPSGGHSQDTAIIGDRMDTDIVAGIECGLDTVLVLSGVTDRTMIDHFPYRPRLVLSGVGEIPAAAESRRELAVLEGAAG